MTQFRSLFLIYDMMNMNDCFEKFDDGTKRYNIDGICNNHISEYKDEGIVVFSKTYCEKLTSHLLISPDLELTSLPITPETVVEYLEDEDVPLPKYIKEISYDGIAYGPTDDPRQLYSNWYDFPQLARDDIWKCLKPRKYGSMRHAWWENYRVTHWNSAVYIVSEILETEDDQDEERIITILYDPEYSLQSGDCFSSAYLINKKHIMIRNCGDVSSIVIIKMLQ